MLLGIIIYKTLIISKKYNLNNYNELLNKIIKNKKIQKIIKIIINIFLISSFYIMIAGFSAYFYQEYKINKIISSLLLVILCYITFNKKSRKNNTNKYNINTNYNYYFYNIRYKQYK